MTTINRTHLTDIQDAAESLTELSSTELELVRGGNGKDAPPGGTYDDVNKVCKVDPPQFIGA